MKKRIMALFLAMAMVVVATACGKGYKVGDKGEVYNDFIKIKKWKELEVERVDPTPVKDEDINMSIESDLQTLAETIDITVVFPDGTYFYVLECVGKYDDDCRYQGSVTIFGSGR